MAFRLRREQRKKLRSAASGGDECRQGEELKKRPLPKRRSACKSSPCEKSPAAGPNDLLPPRQTGRCAKHHGRRRQPAQPAANPAAAAAGISAAPAAGETAGCADLIPGGFDPRAGLRPRIADPFAEERYGRPKRHPADDDAAPPPAASVSAPTRRSVADAAISAASALAPPSGRMHAPPPEETPN